MGGNRKRFPVRHGQLIAELGLLAGNLTRDVEHQCVPDRVGEFIRGDGVENS